MNNPDKLLTMAHITYLKYVEQFPDAAQKIKGREGLLASAVNDTVKLFDLVKEVTTNGK